MNIVSRRLFGRQLMSRLRLCCRSSCLPLLSLTKTPRGGNLEWMAACCDPFFDYCERSVWLIGMLCFILVIIGISLVVFTFYKYMVPFLYKTENAPLFGFYFIYGHYLLINVVFHYFKGVYTSPGKTMKGGNVKLTELQIKHGWKVCYKCDTAKPPRAHHCRICGRAARIVGLCGGWFFMKEITNCQSSLYDLSCLFTINLKMIFDVMCFQNGSSLSHIAWMFNCIGQYNHRHFMLFIIFMWLGVCYVVHCAWTRVIAAMHLDTGFLRTILNSLGLMTGVERAKMYPLDHRGHESFLVIIVFFIAFGVVIALLLLGGWNMYLVSRAETAIEFYTNKRDAMEKKRSGKKFVNPYNHGFKKNWMLFLGLDHRRSFFRHVLLPSGHPPIEDGMNWLRTDATNTNNGYVTSDV